MHHPKASVSNTSNTCNLKKNTHESYMHICKAERYDGRKGNRIVDEKKVMGWNMRRTGIEI